MQILDGAIFIADSHFNLNKLELREFLNQINSSKIKATQIFFLGDIFDFLTSTTKIQEIFKYEIDLINQISLKIPCFYFEGNHDFNLKNIFKNVKVFGIKDQPVKFNLANKKAILMHGDRHINSFSLFFLLILRNKILLKFLDFIDKRIDFKITKAILKSQENKRLDFKIKDFKKFIYKKIKNIDADILIEGHFHQDTLIDFKNLKYINLNSFANDFSYLKLKIENNSFKFVKKRLEII